MLVRLFTWGNPESADPNGLDGLSVGDKVVVKKEWGNFLGELVDDKRQFKESTGEIIRKASAQDLEIALKNKDIEKQLKIAVKKKVREKGFTMKITEVKLSIDGRAVLVVFTADSRIDFREMVRELSAELGKTIRFHQIGSRDEAKKIGGFGICGRELCCLRFNKNFKSINTDMARSQAIAHRGSERLSGICGRLMCCLSYEAEQYEDALKQMPAKGSKVILNREEVEVVDLFILDKKVKIVDKDRKYRTVNLEDIKIIEQ